ncbi:MAG: ATP-dependent sacrificial sulfur transferase LarE [Methanosphaera sp.]|nr:ATP-dependent sacrificial sulfur transferase LarE [Methanosphaera sp.]
MEIEDKIRMLEDYLKNKKCILAFSAGSDSTLLAYILSKVSPNSLLVTIDNNMMPDEFINYTKKQAKHYCLKHEIITLDFLKNPEFMENKKTRCYECRKLMYSNIQKLPQFHDYEYFIEGTNITDLLEDRPGILVRDMFNMTSPLVECDITKQDVYDMIEHLNLDYSNNTTCLATRVKINETVSHKKLDMINKAEKLLRNYIKQENIRIRFDNYSAIITVDNPEELLDKNLIKDTKIKLKEIGFKKILLDITGYEKTQLNFKIDSNGYYYYKLPYKINLEKTKEKIESKKTLTEKTKLNDKLIYDDIIIEENGKISIPPTGDFNNKFNPILSTIERKSI